MFSPPLKKSIVFLKYALKMDLVKGAWFDLYGAQASALVYSMVEIAKANGVNVYHYLTYLLEKMPSDRMSDEELELLAPWNENVKTEIQHRVNNTDQSDVNCQGTPATEK